MTAKSIDEMTPEALRIAMAESQGWSEILNEEGFTWGVNPKEKENECGGWMTLPDYHTDRNALTPVLEKLTEDQKRAYICNMKESLTDNGFRLSDGEIFAIATATPEQCCRAYLKAIL